MNKTPTSGSRGKKKSTFEPLYERHPETGKMVPLPLPESLWKRPLQEKKSSEKKQRRKFELQPLDFTNFEEIAPIKKRKLDLGSASKVYSARRIHSKPRRASERFPVTSSLRSGQSNAAKSTNSKKPTITNTQDKSPLMNLEDVEDELIKTNSALKVPKKFNFAKNSPKVSATASRMTIITEESDSTETFLENEMNCMSPLVSNGVNMTNNIGDLRHIIDVIENVLKKEEEAFENYTKIHQDNMKQMKQLLNLYSNKIKKENGRKFVTTPNSTKENLRKKVLKKNLHNEVQQSPRTRNALSLYNSLRETNSVLETPRLTRHAHEDSPGKVLSDALMKQCLLLQTPIHK